MVPGEEPFQDGLRRLDTQTKEENVIQERLHRQWHTQKTLRTSGCGKIQETGLKDILQVELI